MILWLPSDLQYLFFFMKLCCNRAYDIFNFMVPYLNLYEIRLPYVVKILLQAMTAVCMVCFSVMLS